MPFTLEDVLEEFADAALKGQERIAGRSFFRGPNRLLGAEEHAAKLFSNRLAHKKWVLKNPEKFKACKKAWRDKQPKRPRKKRPKISGAEKWQRLKKDPVKLERKRKLVREAKRRERAQLRKKNDDLS